MRAWLVFGLATMWQQRLKGQAFHDAGFLSQSNQAIEPYKECFDTTQQLLAQKWLTQRRRVLILSKGESHEA